MTILATIALSLMIAVSASADDRQPQVVGGEPVFAGQFPFVVRVNIAGGGTCTGSLVRNNWVLTAAHCGGTGAPISVLIGDAVSQTDGPDHIVTTLPVAQWIPHPGYTPSTSANDIALIRLASDATQVPPRLNGAAQYTPQPIALATSPSSTGGGIGAVNVAGFGLVDADDAPGTIFPNPGYVYFASALPTYSIAQCDPLYGGSQDGSKQLCYGGYPGDCSGDSGGPVFKGSGGGFTQVGVVSFGSPQCGVAPSVATYVPAYVAWINQQINGTTPANPIQYGWELPPSSADGVASGISNAQGWAFSTAGSITSVRLERNGQHFLTLPCCSERGDVRAANPAAPLLSGFSAAASWGNLGGGTSNLTLIIRDSAGNERRETRTIKSVQLLNGVSFARDLGFGQNSICQFGYLNGTNRVAAECTGLIFQQGTCNGAITFAWLNGKQAFEVVDGCH